jgi:cellulose synthase operon protein C
MVVTLKIPKVLWVTLFLFPALVHANSGIDYPSIFDQGTAFLRARAYHLALDRFFLAGEFSHDDAERAEALRWTGEAHLRDKQYDSAYHDFLTSLRLDSLSNDAFGTEFKSAVALVYDKKYSDSMVHLNHLAQKTSDISTLSDIYFWQAECDYQMGQYADALRLYQTILDKKPKYKHALLVSYLMNWCSFQQKDYENAYEGFKTLSSNQADKNLAKLSTFQTAECQFWMGNYVEAQSAYEQFTQTYAGDEMEPAADYGWGWSLAKQDKHTEAAEQFQKIVTNFPKNALAPWAALREGAEDFAANDNDEARKYYEAGLTLCDGKTPADFLNYGLGWLDYSEQNYADAVAQFQKVEKFDPKSLLYWNAVYLEAGCDYLQGKYDDAKKIYAEIEDPAPTELVQDAAYWTGWCDYALAHYDAALTSFLFVAQNTQGEIQTRGFWGAAESEYELSRYSKAADDYQQALKNNPSAALAADCASGLGWSQFQQEKYSEAIDAFEIAVQKAPGTPTEAEALLRIADSYYNLHDYKKAAEIYQKAISENTGKSQLDAMEQSGWCSYRQDQFTDAVSLWGGLLKKDGVEDRKSRLLYWSAWAYFRAKDFKNAQLLFHQVDTDYPQDSLAPEAHLREGDCFFNLQQFNDSKDAYQSFIDTYPNHALLPDALYGLQWSADKLGLKDEASQAAKNFLKNFRTAPLPPAFNTVWPTLFSRIKNMMKPSKLIKPC